MGKFYLVSLSEPYGAKAIIGEGKMLKFQYNGTFIGEYPLEFNMVTMQEVDILSLLVEEDSIEVAYNIDGLLTIKELNQPLSEIAQKLNIQQGLIHMGYRSVYYQNAKAVQYLYTYIKGSITTAIL